MRGAAKTSVYSIAEQRFWRIKKLHFVGVEYEAICFMQLVDYPLHEIAELVANILRQLRLRGGEVQNDPIDLNDRKPQPEAFEILAY
jgi:hypothetical protein